MAQKSGPNFTTTFFLVICLIMCCVLKPCVTMKTYDGFQVIRAFPLNITETENILKSLEDWAGGSKDVFRVWGHPNAEHLDLAIHRNNVTDVVRLLGRNYVPVSILIRDLSRAFKRSKRSICEDEEYTILHQMDGEMNWCEYHRLEDIYNYMEDMAVQNATTVTVETMGKTYEKRPLKVLRINTAGSKDIIWIDAGIHGREWIGPAVVTYFMKMLVENYHQQKELVDAFEWYLMPVHNPDGYEFSHTEDRMWKKTRSDHGSERGCRGVDANKNFDFEWLSGLGGATKDKCSENYAGPWAESEEIVSMVRAKMLNISETRGKIVGYFTFHSYGQVWGLPWGWSSTPPRNAANLNRVARAAVAAIQVNYQTRYEIGPVTDLLAVSSGSSIGWAATAGKIPYAFHIELRDDGKYGYALPPKFILPTAIETFAGLKAAALEMKKISEEASTATMEIEKIRKERTSARDALFQCRRVPFVSLDVNSGHINVSNIKDWSKEIILEDEKSSSSEEEEEEESTQKGEPATGRKMQLLTIQHVTKPRNHNPILTTTHTTRNRFVSRRVTGSSNGHRTVSGIPRSTTGSAKGGRTGSGPRQKTGNDKGPVRVEGNATKVGKSETGKMGLTGSGTRFIMEARTGLPNKKEILHVKKGKTGSITGGPTYQIVEAISSTSTTKRASTVGNVASTAGRGTSNAGNETLSAGNGASNAGNETSTAGNGTSSAGNEDYWESTNESGGSGSLEIDNAEGRRTEKNYKFTIRSLEDEIQMATRGFYKFKRQSPPFG